MDAPLPANLDAEQTANAYTIWREFKKAYPDLEGGTGLAMAAIVNAKAESNLRNVKTGIVGEDSVGLFQLNITNPHGAALVGITDRRYNPAANTRGIIASLEDSGGPVFDGLRNNASVATIAGLFRRYVERPANAAQRQSETEDLTFRLYPRYANDGARSLPTLSNVVVPFDFKTIGLAIAAAFAGAYALGVF